VLHTKTRYMRFVHVYLSFFRPLILLNSLQWVRCRSLYIGV